MGAIISSAIRAGGETSVSDYHIGVSENESTSPSPPHDKEPGTEPVNRIADIASKWLEHSDAIIHGIIGISFLSDLLTVVIIMEVLRTVIHYLKEYTTSLRPFLFIGIVSATRGILSIGARLAVEKMDNPEFTRAMIELGVDALVILVLGITLKLLGKLDKES